VLSVLGDSTAGQAHERRAQEALARHRIDQVRVLEVFSGLLEARRSAAPVKTAPC
jgi:hypothetical protein